MPGTNVSQYSSLGKRGTHLYLRHNAQQINVQTAAIYISTLILIDCLNSSLNAENKIDTKDMENIMIP